MKNLLLLSIFIIILISNRVSAQNADCRAIWQQGIMGDCIGDNAMVAADIDNDGKIELIIGANTMWYVLKWSDEMQDYSLIYMSRFFEEYIESLTLLDVDDDGSQEVLVGNSQGQMFVFDAASGILEDTLIIDNNISNVNLILVADADNDGLTELVVCTYDKTFLFSRTGGEYKHKLTIDQGGSDLDIGDVDGDLANELIYSTGKMFRLNGNVPILVWEFDDNYNNNADLLLADLDSDGIQEIIYSGQYSLMGVFDADIRKAKWTDSSGGVDALIIADSNDDGIPELIVGDSQFGDIVGRDPFDGSEKWRVPNPGYGVNFLCVADTDHDGALELAWAEGCGSTGEDYMHIYSLPDLEHEWTSLSTWGSFSIKVANVDNDPLPEVITLSSFSSSCESGIISIFDALTRTLEWQSEPDFMTNSNWYGMNSIEITDIDNDGTIEIIIAGAESTSAAIWIIDPVAHTVESSHTWNYDPSEFIGFGVADTDLNGSKEIIAATDRFLYIINPSDWSFTWQSPIDNNNFSFSRILADNIDGDPQPEIIAACGKLVVVDALTYERWDTPDHRFINYCTYDCNNDGIKEIVAGNKDGEIAIVNGTNHEINWLPIHTGKYISGIRVANISGGPDPELIFASDGKVHFSTFGGQMHSTEPVGPESFQVNFEVADYDLDGKPDIFAGTMIEVIEWDRQCWKCIDFSTETLTTNASCNQADGTAAIVPLNGTEPYYILWSTGETTPEVANLTAGVYTCGLTDSRGCSLTRNLIVSEDPFVADTHFLFPNNIYLGGCDGMAVISTEGGIPPYRYAWQSDTILMQNDTIHSLCPGYYEFLILDANNCIDTIRFTIDQTIVPPILNYTFNVYPIPTWDILTVEIEWPSVNTPNNHPVRAELQTIQGQRIFTFELMANKNLLNLTSLATGMYLLILSVNDHKEIIKIEKIN